MRNGVTALLLATLVLSAGCSGGREYDGPQRFPLTGKVSFDGEPVHNGSITFMPSGHDGRVSGGSIIDGEYSVPEAKGANEGDYQVQISLQKPTGKKILASNDSEGGELVDATAEAIPVKYNRRSELKVTVGKDSTNFDFLDLASK